MVGFPAAPADGRRADAAVPEAADMGSAVVLALLTFILLFVAGARTGYILGAFLLALPAAWYLIMGTDWRRRRWEAFIDPWRHRHGSSRQLIESLLSFGNGGFGGVGLGDSRQKLLFLPRRTPTSSGPSSARSSASSASAGSWRRTASSCGAACASHSAPPTTTAPTSRSASRRSSACKVLINLGVAMGVLPTGGSRPFHLVRRQLAAGQPRRGRRAPLGVARRARRGVEGAACPTLPGAHRGRRGRAARLPGVAVADALARPHARPRRDVGRHPPRHRGASSHPVAFEPIDVSRSTACGASRWCGRSRSSGPPAPTASAMLRRDRPQVVLGVGGYAGGRWWRSRRRWGSRPRCSSPTRCRASPTGSSRGW